jgi:hypothetical protein
MAFKDLFFGNAPIMGLDDEYSKLARMLILSNLGQGFMGAVNNRAPGGIDMGSVGQGMGAATQGLAQLMQRQRQEQMRQQETQATSDYRASQLANVEYKQQQAELERAGKRRGAEEILGQSLPADISETELNAVINQYWQNQWRPERAEPAPRRIPGTQDGTYGLGTFDAAGNYRFDPAPPNFTPQQTDRAPRPMATGYDEFGNRVTEYDKGPPRVDAPKPPPPGDITEVQRLKIQLRQAEVKEYKSRKEELEEKYASDPILLEDELRKLRGEFNWPATFDPNNIDTWLDEFLATPDTGGNAF